MLTIRSAVANDVPTLLALIGELAEYERLADEVVASEAELHAGLFGPQPRAAALLALWQDQPVGFALYFHNYSTFVGRAGLYLEDLYVQPAFRRRGIGRALLRRLARLAVERNCGRMEWSVLDWNRPALDFYASLGAVPMSDWTVHRLAGEALRRLAGESADGPVG